MRNYNLDLMVSPEKLEDKMHILQNQMTSMSDKETNRLENTIHVKAKEIHDYCAKIIKERIGKKDFKDFESFILNLIRENKSIAKQSEAQLNTLQTKYENLDTFYVTHEHMKTVMDKLETFQNETKK